MSIEQKINTFMNKVPVAKKIVKRVYQLSMYSLSSNVKSEGNIKRITPMDGHEYFFGYYDKSPWDASDRYMLCLRVKDTTKSVAPEESAEILLIDTFKNNSIEVIGTTNTWNVQQGSMLQWLGPDFSEKIIYNDFRENEYCSVIYNIITKESVTINKPIYSVSNTGKFALTLDFSRLHRLRKGYGYSNKAEVKYDSSIPDQPCIWHIDLEKNKVKPILNYTDLANFENRVEMNRAEHKVNHIMINPSGNRFMVLHRWLNGGKRYTRLLTANVDGSDLYNLSDDNMTSHCYWKNDHLIIGFANKNKIGNGYFEMRDKSKQYSHIIKEIDADGHPSTSPDGSSIVTDTYPDRTRMSSVYLINKNTIKTIARVYAPFKYDNDLRCDLHPKWNRQGNKISIDSTFEGKRHLYILSINS
ncbi:MAG: hypothetical protein JJU16_03340 [Alkalibacterium sp.]|nr:hypothetical protein [Alkalibacterium sp.]